MQARWGSIGASVRGASHLREGSPNQDALLVAERAGTCLALVADGHGGARHFRSATGARLAVEAAADVLQQLAPTFAHGDAAAQAQLAATELPVRIVEAWRERVHRDLAQAPLDGDELEKLRAAEGADAVAAVRADPQLAYGATLLAAATVGADGLVIAQIGDGDVLLVDAQGRTQRPLPADERLTGHMTTSICRAEAASDFRTTVVWTSAADAALLVLATDGYANSFRSDADFVKVGGDFLELLRHHGPAAVQQQLPDILAHASTHGSGDDITVAMLLAPLAALADDTATVPSTAKRENPHEKHPRGWIVAGTLAAAALVYSILRGPSPHPDAAAPAAAAAVPSVTITHAPATAASVPVAPAASEPVAQPVGGT